MGELALWGDPFEMPIKGPYGITIGYRPFRAVLHPYYIKSYLNRAYLIYRIKQSLTRLSPIKGVGKPILDGKVLEAKPPLGISRFTLFPLQEQELVNTQDEIIQVELLGRMQNRILKQFVLGLHKALLQVLPLIKLEVINLPQKVKSSFYR